MKNLFNSTAVVQTITNTQNDYGETIEATTNSTPFSCRIQQLSAKEKAIAGSEGASYTHKMWCTEFDGINSRDRIISRGFTFEVDSVDNFSYANRLMFVTLKIVLEALEIELP